MVRCILFFIDVPTAAWRGFCSDLPSSDLRASPFQRLLLLTVVPEGKRSSPNMGKVWVMDRCDLVLCLSMWQQAVESPGSAKFRAKWKIMLFRSIYFSIFFKVHVFYVEHLCSKRLVICLSLVVFSPSACSKWRPESVEGLLLLYPWAKSPESLHCDVQGAFKLINLLLRNSTVLWCHQSSLHSSQLCE